MKNSKLAVVGDFVLAGLCLLASACFGTASILRLVKGCDAMDGGKANA